MKLLQVIFERNEADLSCF